jgi:hypothetical protein
MSIPVGTVRSRVFRARDLIDNKLRRVHDGGLGRRPAKQSANSPGLRDLSAVVGLRG